MGQAELDSSKPLGFPPYRRSHLRSQTYLTLVRIFSHLPSTPDNGSDRMEQDREEKGPEFSEFVGSDFMGPKDSVPKKITQEVHETIEGAEDKGREFGANDMALSDIEEMMGLEDVEDASRKLLEDMSEEANDFNEQQRIMDELALAVNGTEDLVCDSDLMPLNSGLGEKQNGSSEVELMDYQVEHVEFHHSDVNKSGNASELQVQGELDQLASESFHPSLTVDVSTSTEVQTSAFVISTSGIEHEILKNEMDLAKADCAAMDSLPNAKESEFEKEKQCCSKVAEALHVSLDHTASEALNVCEDGRLLNSAILGDKHELKNEEKLKKSICANNASNSSNILIEKGDIEEGELVGDFGMDVNSFDMPSEDSLISHQKNLDEAQEPKSIVKDIVFPGKRGNGEKGGYESNSFTANTHQDGCNSGQVEARTGNKNGFACRVELEISQETVKCYKAAEGGSVLKPRNSIDKQIGSKAVTHLPTNYAQNQVLHRGLLEEDSNQDHGNSSASKQKVDVSSKKKRGPGSEEKKAKKKKKKRKNRAEKNRQLGVKRLKLPPVQKPKTISYCRHYVVGRCYEGDKCQFSHDTVPLTKSKPCSFFARHSCMKGDDCPFDHQLSKYPCDNFVSRGFCSRGDACLFSHQLPTKEDIPTPSKVCRPELKSPLLSGNTSFSVPPNNRGCNSDQQNHFINSAGIHSHVNSEHKVTDTVEKQLTPAPKGVSFISTANSSLPSPTPSSPKEGMTTPDKESPVQDGTCADQSASGTSQTLVEIPKKLPARAPKGINFLSFGEGSVCSSRSSISSLLNEEDDIKLLEFVNFSLPDHASSSLEKDDDSKAIDETKQSVPETDLVPNEIFDKNQSVEERVKLSSPGKASMDTTDVEGSSYSHADHSDSKPVQEVKEASDNSQTSAVTSSMLLVSPLSSEPLPSRNHEDTSNSGQRALLSTLSFAAEHESVIKMKDLTGASPVQG